MKMIISLSANDDFSLDVGFVGGAKRKFNVAPLLTCEAFRPLADIEEFQKVRNFDYYVEWPCGADLSADTIYHTGKHI